MDNDDRPIGRILRRREVLALFGGSSAALIAACAPASGLSASAAPSAAATTVATPAATPATTGAAVALPSCIVRPALTEGPYFVDEKLNRSDVRTDSKTGSARPGLALALTFNVAQVASAGCTALPNAQVDIWHCDANGVYSDAQDPNFGSTRGQNFLRGYQITDANGQARFTTIYPGWYQGRAVHVHFKIRTTSAGRTADFTSQLFFDEAVNDAVLSQPPYSQHPASGRLRNERDGIYQGGGDKLLVKPAQSGSIYTAGFDIGLAS